MNHVRPTRHLWLCMTLGLISAWDSSLFAQKAPAAGYIFPAGGKAGTTVEVQLGGYDWTPDLQFLLHDSPEKPGKLDTPDSSSKKIRLEVLAIPGDVIPHRPPYWFGIKSMVNDPPLPREVTARFVLPADLPPGPVRWCVANANGGSPCGLFIVGDTPEVIEEESRSAAQTLPTLPVTVNGRLLQIEEVDRYSLSVERSGLVTCELTARRLGSDLFGVLEVLDEHGKRVAEAIDTEGQDPVLTFFAHAGQNYTVTVRDLDYRGYRCLTYRLGITTGPRVIGAIPAAGRRGETRPVEFVGLGIATGQPRLETLTQQVTFPTEPGQASFSYRLQTPAGTAAEFPLSLSDFNELIEPDEVNPAGRRLTVPTAITGRLDNPSRQDRYTLAGLKGDIWNLSAEARGLGSSLDLALSVLDADGKELAQNDDAPGTTNPRLTVTLPADGDFQLVVSDVSGAPDGLRSIYRLVTEAPRNSFRLRSNGILNLPLAAGAGTLEGTVVREGGFKEPIKLVVTGLPVGVTAPAEILIEPAAATFKIPLTIDPQAPASSSFVQIQGTATSEGHEFIKPVLVPATGSLVVRDAETNLVPFILMTTTLKVPFKIKPTEADGGRRVHRGATHLAELIVERDPGFSGEIVLDMSAAQSRHRQGIHGPRFSIPLDLKTVAYPVFVPECLETARTSRLGLVAMTKVRDSQGNERTVLAAVEGQITMSIEGALLKLSQTADEYVIPIGQSVVIPLKLAKSRTLTGPVSVELVIPKELSGLIQAPPLTLSTEQEGTDWTITTQPDRRLLGTKVFTGRATTMRDGFPAISECLIEIEFVESALTSSAP